MPSTGSSVERLHKLIKSFGKANQLFFKSEITFWGKNYTAREISKNIETNN